MISGISWEMKGFAPNQIELLKNSPDFLSQLEKKFNVTFKFHTISTPIQYECSYQNKYFKFAQMSIVDIEVDAIVNPHGKVLVADPNLVQGTSKAIIAKAGSNYQKQLLSKKKLQPSEIFTTDAYELKNCKKIINIYNPPYSLNSNYCDIIMKSYQNIFEEAEKQGVKKLGLTLLGSGCGGFPLHDGFLVLFKFLHDSFFLKDLKNLKEVYLCELDGNKIIKLRETIQKKINNFPEGRKSVYLWKWMDDDLQFKTYDECINDYIDENYEKFIKKKKSNHLKLDFIIHKVPGTHKFNLNNMTVTDISRGKMEKISINENNEWCHGKLQKPYESYISEIINLKKASNIPIFELFLKKYYLDFDKMKQINRQTKFIRELKKEPLNNSSDNDEISSFIPRIKFENHVNLDFLKYNFTINGVGPNHNDENICIIDKEIRNFMSSHFKEIEKNFKGLNNEKHEQIYQFCKKHKIYFTKDKKFTEDIFSFVLPNEALKKLGKFLENIYYPWDNEDAQFKLVDLEPTENDYEFVATNFNKSWPGAKILSVKRIQNKELYNLYQSSKDKVKRDFEESDLICKNFNNYEKLLWHGTRTVDPNGLICRSDTWLNKNYSGIKNIFGNGIYFAEKPIASDCYAFQTTGKSKILILAQVFVGESYKTQEDSSLKEPPIRPGFEQRQLRYNSVQGDTPGSKIYVVYGENQSYPAYMVEYSS